MGKFKANQNVTIPGTKGVVMVVGAKQSEVLIQDRDDPKNNQTVRVDNNKIK